ncbi:MAG: hypothetical protein BWY32_02662 [bacterium ADurb.Bin243]|nr:MAG: hypothetical protein BWY32_02662 [bacterium ADurb.Bin243]
MKLKFRKLKLVIFIFFASVFAMPAFAGAKPSPPATFKLCGYVSCQKTSAPIAKAEVKIRGKKKPLKTSDNGYYELNVAAGETIIVFSKKGYKDEELALSEADFEPLQREITRNAAMCPVEKKLKIRGRLIDRVSGSGVKAELRVNDEIAISNHDGYFDCETYDGAVDIKVYSKAHRPYSKTFKKGDIDFLKNDKELEIFLQRYTFYSIVSGSVLEKKDKKPIYEAVVEIAGKRVLTDNYGNFEMQLDESGTQKLICSREGFEKISRQVKIKAGLNKIKIYMNVKEKGLIQQLREKYEKENLY